MTHKSSFFQRLFGIAARHFFLLRSSWPRVVELLYWPTLNLLIWGFLNTYLSKQFSGTGLLAASLMGGAMLMEFMTRSQTGILVTFLEEAWSRNLGNLFVAPIPPLEYALSAVAMSILRVAFATLPCWLMAGVFFDFWMPSMGWSLVGFILNLAMTGWSMCFLALALMLRQGMAVEWLAWMASFVLSPIVGVYYPVSILPEWLQPVSYLLPPTYIFEGMRALMNGGEIRLDLMALAFGLNLPFFAASLWVFHRAFEKTRQDRGLLQALE